MKIIKGKINGLLGDIVKQQGAEEWGNFEGDRGREKQQRGYTDSLSVGVPS